MIQLALQTGIPPSVWAAEGERTIVTAYDILEDAADHAKGVGR